MEKSKTLRQNDFCYSCGEELSDDDDETGLCLECR